MTDSTASGQPPDVVLSATGIVKNYPGTRALDEANLEVRRGEVHALLGGNGSGKSTFIQILAGVTPADAGTVSVGGREISVTELSPKFARDHNLLFVHQQNTTFPDLSVAENLFIGNSFNLTKTGRIDWRETHRRARKLLSDFNIAARPEQVARELSAAARMKMAVARALQNQADSKDTVLVLDEVTAALPSGDAQTLLDLARDSAALGHAVIFVTHRLEEVLSVADRATVLRDGRTVANLSGSELNHQELVLHIVGNAVEKTERERQELVTADEVLRVENLTGGAAHDVSFALREGEIVGLTGLIGSGRSSLLRMLFGGLRPTDGRVVLFGKDLRLKNTAEAIELGMAYVPEERSQAGFDDDPLSTNLSAGFVKEFWRMGLLSHRREKRVAESLIDTFGVKASGASALFRELSGGNQQKVILARWLSRAPRLVLLDEPTQGVDIGARFEMYDLIRSAAREGATVLLASSDFDEIAHLCDRALVLRRGRIVEELDAHNLNVASLAEAAYREEPHHAA